MTPSDVRPRQHFTNEDIRRAAELLRDPLPDPLRGVRGVRWADLSPAQQEFIRGLPAKGHSEAVRAMIRELDEQVAGLQQKPTAPRGQAGVAEEYQDNDLTPGEFRGARMVAGSGLIGVVLLAVLLAAMVGHCAGPASAQGGLLVCDPPEACEEIVQCGPAPMRCVDVTAIQCGTTAPVTCEAFEASLTKALIDSEAPAVPPGLMARVRGTTAWKVGQKLDAGRVKVMADARSWFEAYLVFKGFQPHTPSTGKTIVEWHGKAPAAPDLELAKAIEAIDAEEEFQP